MAQRIEIVRGVLPTTGNAYTDFTVPGFGSPDAAIVITTGATAFNEIPDTNERFSYGIWSKSGPAQYAMGAFNTDNVGTSIAYRQCISTGVVVIPKNNATDLIIQASEITDGLRLTKLSGNSEPSGSYTTMVIMFQGVEAKASAITVNWNIVQNSGSLGFAPELVFFLNQEFSSESVTLQLRTGIGVSSRNNKNLSFHNYTAGNAATSQTSGKISNSFPLQNYSANGPSVGEWGDDYFKFASQFSSVSNNNKIPYLALGGNDLSYEVGINKTPRLASTQRTETKIIPNVLLLFSTGLTTFDVNNNTEDSTKFSIGAAKKEKEQLVGFVVSEDNNTISYAKSGMSQEIIRLRSLINNSYVSPFVSGTVSFYEDKYFDITYTNADGQERLGFWVAFGTEADIQAPVERTNLAISGQAPTFEFTRGAQPTEAIASIAGQVPSAWATVDNPTIAVGAASLTATGYKPAYKYPAKTAVVRGTLSATLNGTTDFEVTGFGTPTGAIIIVSGANTTANPSSPSEFSVGFWDGTNQVSGGNHNTAGAINYATGILRNNVGVSIPYFNGSAYAIKVAYTVSNAPGGNGIRLTLTTDNITVQLYATVILFSGITTKVGTLTLPALGSSVSSGELGFTPSMVLGLSNDGTAINTIDTSGANFGISIASRKPWLVAENKTSACCLNHYEDTGMAPLDAAEHISYSKFLDQTGSITEAILSFLPTSFSIKRIGGSAANLVVYMAFAEGDLEYEIVSYTAPSEVGLKKTELKCLPETVLIFQHSAYGKYNTFPINQMTTVESVGSSFGIVSKDTQYVHSIAADPSQILSSIYAESYAGDTSSIRLRKSASGVFSDELSGSSILDVDGVITNFTTVYTGRPYAGVMLAFGQSQHPNTIIPIDEG